MILSPLLHIDFIVTFQNEHKTTGYWFLTWIRGKNSVEVWRKRVNRGWSLEGGTVNDMQYKEWAKKDDLFNKRQDVFYRDIAIILAIPEKANELDKILFDHMSNNGIPYKSPYKYWLDPNEADPNDPEY
jgi:hypothetical protein